MKKNKSLENPNYTFKQFKRDCLKCLGFVDSYNQPLRTRNLSNRKLIKKYNVYFKSDSEIVNEKDAYGTYRVYISVKEYTVSIVILTKWRMFNGKYLAFPKSYYITFGEFESYKQSNPYEKTCKTLVDAFYSVLYEKKKVK